MEKEMQGVTIMKQLLTRHQQRRAHISALQRDIAEKEYMLRLESSVHVSRLDGGRSASVSRFSAEEHALEQKERFEKELAYMRREVQDEEEKAHRLESTLQDMTMLEYRLIYLRFIEGCSWNETARRSRYSPSYAQHILNMVLQQMYEELQRMGITPDIQDGILIAS